MIKAIIYDMDDLMVNSIKLHYEAFDVLLREYGHKYGDLPQNLRARFVGTRIIDIVKEIVKYFNLNANIDAFYEERNSIFLKLAKEKLEAMHGLLESLNLFKKNNFKIGLASSGTRKYIDLVLDKFGIKNYFDVIVSGDDVTVGKPNPETYMVACEKLGLPPEQCIILEDATNGIEAAKTAGCKCIAIVNHNNPPQDYSKADIVLDSLLNVDTTVVNSF